MAVKFDFKVVILLICVKQVYFEQDDYWFSYLIHFDALYPAQKCIAKKYHSELAGTTSYVLVKNELPSIFWLMKDGVTEKFDICSDSSKNLNRCRISKQHRGKFEKKVYQCEKVKDETELPSNRVIDIRVFYNKDSKLATVTWSLLRIPSENNFVHFEISVCEETCGTHEKTNATLNKHFTFPIEYSTQYTVLISIANDDGIPASRTIWTPEDPGRYYEGLKTLTILQSLTLAGVILLLIWLTPMCDWILNIYHMIMK